EALVRKRQLNGIAEMEPPDDLRLAMHQRRFRDVEAEGLEARADLDQALDQEALAAAYGEHGIAEADIEVLHHLPLHANPTDVGAWDSVARGGARSDSRTGAADGNGGRRIRARSR